MANEQQPLGTVVLDELIAPVVRIEMRGGAFVVWAHIAGPVGAREEGWYDCVLHGSDGVAVLSGKVFTGWAEARTGDQIEFSFAAEPKDNTFAERGAV